jgi:uncharacterized protein
MNVAALPVITVLATAILAIGAASLAIWVIVQRVRLKIEWGDGGNLDMAQAVRAHANFAEHVPMVLLAIGASEVTGASRPLLIGLAASLIAARALSAYGLIRSQEHFPTEVAPGSAKKMRQNIILEHCFDSVGTERALGPSWARQAGASITIAVMIVAAIAALLQAVRLSIH